MCYPKTCEMCGNLAELPTGKTSFVKSTSGVETSVLAYLCIDCNEEFLSAEPKTIFFENYRSNLRKRIISKIIRGIAIGIISINIVAVMIFIIAAIID